MAKQTVEFQFMTGLKRFIFRNARLHGSWDANGRFANIWATSPMQEVTGEDGCPMFRASVSLDLSDIQKTFNWGVILDGPQGTNFWEFRPRCRMLVRWNGTGVFAFGEAGLCKWNASISLTAADSGLISTMSEVTRVPGCVSLSGPRTLERWRWSSASRLPGTSLTTATA
jgi:hypothetical protein